MKEEELKILKIFFIDPDKVDGSVLRILLDGYNEIIKGVRKEKNMFDIKIINNELYFSINKLIADLQALSSYSVNEIGEYENKETDDFTKVLVMGYINMLANLASLGFHLIQYADIIKGNKDIIFEINKSNDSTVISTNMLWSFSFFRTKVQIDCSEIKNKLPGTIMSSVMTASLIINILGSAMATYTKEQLMALKEIKDIPLDILYEKIENDVNVNYDLNYVEPQNHTIH